MDGQVVSVIVLLVIGIVSSCISIFIKGRKIKKKDTAIKQQEKIIRRQKKHIKELKAQTAINGSDTKVEEMPQEKLSHSQEYVLKALSFLVNVDPFNRTLADDELESVYMDRLEEIGIPIYLLQGLHEIETCKKLIEELGLDEGLKRIKEKGTDLVFI